MSLISVSRACNDIVAELEERVAAELETCDIAERAFLCQLFVHPMSKIKHQQNLLRCFYDYLHINCRQFTVRQQRRKQLSKKYLKKKICVRGLR